MAQRRQTRVRDAAIGGGAPVHRAVCRLDRYRPSQAVKRKPFDQRFALGRFAIDQDAFIIVPQDEVEQHLPLRSQ